MRVHGLPESMPIPYASGGFKCQQLLTGPLKMFSAGPPFPPKRKKKRKDKGQGEIKITQRPWAHEENKMFLSQDL